MEAFTGCIQCPNCNYFEYKEETTHMYDEETIKFKCDNCGCHYKVTLKITCNYKTELI